jgi:predicted nucleic acid-binding protein
MGLILDSSVAIAAERRGVAAEDLLVDIRKLTGADEVALSVVSVMELEHGIWAPENPSRRCSADSSSMTSLTTFRSIQLPLSWLGERDASMPSNKRGE